MTKPDILTGVSIRWVMIDSELICAKILLRTPLYNRVSTSIKIQLDFTVALAIIFTVS